MAATADELRALVNLAGRDYLPTPDAAFYCGVSERQFRRHAESEGLFPIKFMGKLVYRKSDLKQAIERAAWPQSIGAVIGPTSTGASMGSGSVKASVAPHANKRSGRARSRNSSLPRVSG
jgi:hypothetical protein